MRHSIYNSAQIRLSGTKYITIPLRRSNKAKRLIIRVINEEPGFELVIPKNITINDAVDFAQHHRHWLEARLTERLPRIPLNMNSQIPYLGGTLTLLGKISDTFKVCNNKNYLFISETDRNFEDLAIKKLQNHARDIINIRALASAKRIGQKINCLTVGDAKTQWGSCSSKGNLSFSWRLIMAPENVLMYVISHEVAHLKELNHGDHFWKIVEGLSENISESQQWLRQNSSQLRRYGRSI